MKTRFLLLLMVFLVFLAIAAPVYAKGEPPGLTGPDQGDPPGWSHENPGGGGSENPGPGSEDLSGPAIR